MEGKDSFIDSMNISAGIIRYKLIFIGDAGVGKTTIINVIQGNPFQEQYEETIGVDFWPKTIQFQGKEIKLQMWDTAGQERYKGLIPSYVRNSSIIFLVYDVSNENSFNNMPSWIEFIKKIENLENTLLVLIANKIDIKERIINTTQGKQLAEKENLIFYEISAKDYDKVINMFYNVIVQLHARKEQYNPSDYNFLVQELIKENGIKKKENNKSNDYTTIEVTVKNDEKNTNDNTKKGKDNKEEIYLQSSPNSNSEIIMGSNRDIILRENKNSQSRRLCHC